MSDFYKNKASNANTKINNARISLNDAVNNMRTYLGMVPDREDALSNNTKNSINSVSTEIAKESNSLNGIKSSIMSIASQKDIELDKLKELEDENVNEE